VAAMIYLHEPKGGVWPLVVVSCWLQPMNYFTALTLLYSYIVTIIESSVPATQ